MVAGDIRVPVRRPDAAGPAGEDASAPLRDAIIMSAFILGLGSPPAPKPSNSSAHRHRVATHARQRSLRLEPEGRIAASRTAAVPLTHGLATPPKAARGSSMSN